MYFPFICYFVTYYVNTSTRLQPNNLPIYVHSNVENAKLDALGNEIGIWAKYSFDHII